MIGLLRFNGIINLAQFWPTKESDADTMHVKPVGPIMFEPKTGKPFEVKVFTGAYIKTRKTKTKGVVPIPVLGTSGFSIRLQGIDAPELHYTAQDLKAKKDLMKQFGLTQQQADFVYNDFREPLGERATAELVKFIKPHAPGAIASCVVETRVSKPNDVFDKYGRMIADVTLILSDHQRKSINVWLVENGWAMPTFYVSMFHDEINQLIAAQKAAGKKGVFAQLDDRVRPIDFKLIERKNFTGTPDAKVSGQRDTRVVLPKQFRRLTTWSVKAHVGLLTGSFEAFLVAKAGTGHGKADCYRTKDFLSKGTKAKKITFASLFKSHRLSVGPADLVFSEDTSTLKGPGGKLIKDWK